MILLVLKALQARLVGSLFKYTRSHRPLLPDLLCKANDSSKRPFSGLLSFLLFPGLLFFCLLYHLTHREKPTPCECLIVLLDATLPLLLDQFLVEDL